MGSIELTFKWNYKKDNFIAKPKTTYFTYILLMSVSFIKIGKKELNYEGEDQI